ncbi:MAG: RNA polymerase sigma factor [Acidobacteriota bacterium]
MAKDNPSRSHRIDPTQPFPEDLAGMAKTVSGMLDGMPKDDATVRKALEGMESLFDAIAAGLYTMASMLVGEGEDSIRLVEEAVSNAEVSACTDPEQARSSSHRALARAALQRIAQRDPDALAAPQAHEPASSCIEDDDLASTGLSRDELDHFLSGPGRARMRVWLESLPTATRTIFVLRGVAAFSGAETAALLAENGGPKAAAWTPEAVRESFRHALCSLASQLLHAGAGH